MEYELLKPQFTIIVPVYKVENYIHNCVDSILQQTYSDFELILVDDGSPDNSGRICDEYARMDNRIRVIHKKNEGVVVARNTALFQAKGDYILHVDADDWICENLLETVYHCLENNGYPDMVMFDSERVFVTHKEYMENYLEEGYYHKKRLREEVYPRMIYDDRQPFLTSMIIGQLWNKVFRRELLLEHYLKDKDLYKREDFAYVYECIYYANSMYYCKKPLYYYNKTNETSAMTTYDKTYFYNHRAVIKYVEEHIGEEEIIKRQINAYNVSGIIVGIFQEVRHGRNISDAARHIRKAIEETQDLRKIVLKGLPFHAKVYMYLLKLRMYRVALIGAKIWLRK